MGYLYVIRAEGTDLHKIGITEKSVENRMVALRTNCPYKLRLREAFRVGNARREEKHWHKHFSEKHSNGEWFFLNDADFREMRDKYYPRTEGPKRGLDFIRFTFDDGREQTWGYCWDNDMVYAPEKLLPYESDFYCAMHDGVAIATDYGVMVPAKNIIAALPRWNKSVHTISLEHTINRLMAAEVKVRERAMQDD